jgi:hypothetical protein
MGGKIYSMLFPAFASATLLNWILSKQASRGKIEYETLFYIMGSMAVVAFILAIFFKEQTKVRHQQKGADMKDEQKTLLNGSQSASDLFLSHKNIK